MSQKSWAIKVLRQKISNVIVPHSSKPLPFSPPARAVRFLSNAAVTVVPKHADKPALKSKGSLGTKLSM